MSVFTPVEEATYDLIHAIFEAALKAYDIPNPISDADGPDVEFTNASIKALDAFLKTVGSDVDVTSLVVGE